MSDLAHDPATHSEYRPPGVDGPVLVACDGAPVSSEALFNAGRLAIRAFGGPLQVLGICEPTPGVAVGMGVLPALRLAWWPPMDDSRWCTYAHASNTRRSIGRRGIPTTDAPCRPCLTRCARSSLRPQK